MEGMRLTRWLLIHGEDGTNPLASLTWRGWDLPACFFNMKGWDLPAGFFNRRGWDLPAGFFYMEEMGLTPACFFNMEGMGLTRWLL
jgi:hypothetical protein